MGQIENDRRRMGRPPLPLHEVRDARVVTFLTTEQRDRLQEFAQTSGRSISATAHELIRRNLGSGPINPASSARDQFLPQICLKYEDVAGSHKNILSGFAVKNGRALRVHPESPSCGFIQTTHRTTMFSFEFIALRAFRVN